MSAPPAANDSTTPPGSSTARARTGASGLAAAIASVALVLAIAGLVVHFAFPPATPTANEPLTGQISQYGDLILGHGVVSSAHESTGVYYVTFDRSVQNCTFALVAQLNDYASTAGATGTGETSIYVYVDNNTGALADSSLWVAAFC